MTDIEESLASISIGQGKPWDLEKAVNLCRLLECIAPDYGAHVSLSGGCLYKDGNRKDVDIHFYRIRQIPAIDEPGLLKAIEIAGVKVIARFGWVIKASYYGDPVDLFFPEYKDRGNGGQGGTGNY